MSAAEYLTAAEAAERLGISLRTVRRRIADGSLPGARIGRAVRIPVAALDLLEVASVLERGIRERRIDRPRAEEIMRALASVAFEEIDPHEFAGSAFRLAPRAGTRVPDAAYVEVARARRAILVTADERQLAVAAALGVPVVALADLPPL